MRRSARASPDITTASWHGSGTACRTTSSPRLRRYGDAMTLSDVLERHYGMRTRVVAAIACFVYSAPILAMGGMMVMMDFLGIPKGWGLVVAVGVCAAYTSM